MILNSWGNYPPSTTEGLCVSALNGLQDADTSVPLLAYGNGRSYGDVCLNNGGHALPMRRYNRIRSFDKKSGLLHAEAGLTLAELNPLSLRHGWFTPVTPGTQYVTLGGAVANDVHGKNHHHAGTFGCHVRGLLLQRSDRQEPLWCSPDSNSELFKATVGGLGLTGVIREVQLQLAPVPGYCIEQLTLTFNSLEDFFQLSLEHEQHQMPYTVAWLDCLHPNGRGLFFTGRWKKAGVPSNPRALTVPLMLPFSAINTWSLKAFNTAYYHAPRRYNAAQEVPWQKYFYPLDNIHHWNRLYGRKGFLQHQSVVPLPDAPQVLRAMLTEMQKTGSGSFLAVLKVFGNKTSPGLLSFPMRGASLALDFPFKGKETLKLFDRLNSMVCEAGGRLYAAKDATQTPQQFQQAYPTWQQLERFRDPALSSSFWRRVTTS